MLDFVKSFSDTHILSAMITPAVLITASASLIFSTANRLGRIFDRVNSLKAEAEGVLDGRLSFPVERLDYLSAQLRTQRTRATLIQNAMACLYSATVLFIGASLSLGLTMTWWSERTWIPTLLSLLGGLSMLAAGVILLYESRYNLKFIRGQIDFVQFLEARAIEMRKGTP